MAAGAPPFAGRGRPAPLQRRRAPAGGGPAPLGSRTAFLRALLLLRPGQAAAAAREEPPEALQARGQLPALRVRGLNLTRVFRLSGQPRGGGDWSYTHTAVGPDYHARVARRLAVGLDDLSSDVPFGTYVTPRDRIRALVALNAAVLSPAAYNVTYRMEQWGFLYDQKQQIFFPESGLNATEVSEVGGNVSELLAQGEIEALKEESAEIRAAADSSKFTEYFQGARGSECAGSGESTPPCRGDHGLAMSVYDDAEHTVIVFHGNWDSSEYDYMLWANKLWIMERFELALQLMWSNQAQRDVTPEMAKRAYGAYGDVDSIESELAIRCAYNEFEFWPAPDVDAIAFATGLSFSQVARKGFWNLLQQVVRLVLPEDRTDLKTVYLTGSGRGGTFAALVSLWLKETDSLTYGTYVFAPDGGWQCLARRMLSSDVTATGDHSHILTFSHIMDAYASGVDRVAGKVCLYGDKNFTGAVMDFCSKIVGHTGPQLFFRHQSGPPGPSEEVKRARQYFDACHYFTHSVWYAAILLLDDEVLDLDGTTDGGCQTVDPVPEDDVLRECPVTNNADTACLVTPDTMQALPLMAMGIVMSSLLSMILSAALTGYCMLRRIRNEQWLFNGTKSVSKSKGKAQVAALKARQARDRVQRKEERRIQKRNEKVSGGRRGGGKQDEEMMGVLIGTPRDEAVGEAEPIAEAEERFGEADDAGDAGEESKRRKDKKDKKDKKEKKEKKDKKVKKEKKEELEDGGTYAPELDP